MSDLLQHFHGIFGKPQSIADKIEEISIDAKQKEQITVMFEMAFEMGMAFGRNDMTLEKTDPNYHEVRKTFIALAGPMMV